MDLLKSAKIRVLQSWSTGITSGVSAPLDVSGIEHLTLICTVPQTTTNVTFLVQGSPTTTAGDFAQLQYNSTNLSLASTAQGGCHVIQINKPHANYRYIKTAVNSTGVSSQGEVIAIGIGNKSLPITQVSTEVISSIQAVSPTT